MMRILIVDDEVINASKFKLVLSKYGECDIVTETQEAISKFIQSQQSPQPYGLITLEVTKQPENTTGTVSRIRKWENETGAENQTQILLIISEEDHNQFAPSLTSSSVKYLIKPFNRKKLETALAELGLKKARRHRPRQRLPPPSPSHPAQKTVNAELEVILNKLTALVNDPEGFLEEESPMLAEELVKRGGKQAELLMGQFITSPKLAMHVRLSLIRSAGYILSPLFLVPLNRVIDTEDNIKMVEGALISISKYNNQRALLILNNALKKLKNPMLLNTIRREISKIKHNNPVLSILPRFLNSYKSLKNFRITLEILKKIVTQKDISLFINYIKSGNPVIEDGTFELLCFTGDQSIKTTLFNFFEDRIQRIECRSQKQCDELFAILSYFSAYLLKNPPFIDEQLQELKELYAQVADIQVKHQILSILCKSQSSEALAYIKTIYNTETDLQKSIIENLSGNKTAVDFLFEKYHAGNELKEQVVKSLLKSDKGIQYFITHFFTFELDKQELIIRNLTFTTEPFLVDFIREIYKTQLFSLKAYLLTVIRDNFLFEFRDILLDPDNQREFSFMGKDYLDTIVRLFPLSTMKTIFGYIADGDISTTKIKKYLAWLLKITEIEPVLQARGLKFKNDLFERIFKTNNIEVNTMFFTVFENIRTLDPALSRYLFEGANTFISGRGAAINPTEKGAINKFKQRLTDYFPDIREIQNLQKELRVIFSNRPIIVDSLSKLLKVSQVSVALNIDRVINFLAERMKKGEYISHEDLDLFNIQNPIIARLLDFVWSNDAVRDLAWEQIPPQGPVAQHLLQGTRVVLAFANRRVTAILKDQLTEIIPHCIMVEGADQLKNTDILLCDTPSLKAFIDTKKLATKRILLYLENRADYAPFRPYNAKAFMKPFSAYRVVKLLLQELYTH